ncbi:inner membrane protein YhjD [Pseudonocardia phyllosphaerae]|uniref:inner membrane protein YhjD n=1 Tax=Pseudonocardia phyllosphaerae TaxID=3390502 RepID=UPI00397CD85F
MADHRATTIAHDIADDEEEAVGTFERLREKHPWLDHLVRAGVGYTENHGDHYAAAITYFSLLAVVPLLMVGFATAGFVLRGNPELVMQLKDQITGAVPPEFAGKLGGIVDTAVTRAGAIGIVGLLGALYSGIGWMSNLREALSEQWGQREEAPPFLKRMGGDLLALVGLGIALVLSFAISSVGGSLGGYLLGLVGLGEAGWAKFLLGVGVFVLTLIGNWLVFLWMISRLPREPVSTKSAMKAAIFGAVGFAVLQYVMVNYYMPSVSASPVGAAFGPILGVLVFIFFSARFLLFVTAWAATADGNDVNTGAVPAPAIIRPQYVVREGRGAVGSAGLLVAGLLGGALGTRAFGRKKR